MKHKIQHIVMSIIKSYGTDGITCDGLFKEVSMRFAEASRVSFDVAISRIDGVYIDIKNDRVYFKKKMPKDYGVLKFK